MREPLGCHPWVISGSRKAIGPATHYPAKTYSDTGDGAEGAVREDESGGSDCSPRLMTMGYPKSLLFPPGYLLPLTNHRLRAKSIPARPGASKSRLGGTGTLLNEDVAMR